MAALTYDLFVDLDGTALEGGYVYIGQPNDDPQTQPVVVYWDAGLTVPAAQPLRTSGGVIVRNNAPALVYIANGAAFSVRTTTANGQIVYYRASMTTGLPLERITFPIAAGPQGTQGNPGGNVMATGAFSAVAAITIPVGANRIATDGAAATSDLGEADYVLDAEQTNAAPLLSLLGVIVRDAAVARGQASASATAATQAMESRFRRRDVANRWFKLRSSTSHLAYRLAGDTARQTVQAALDLTGHWFLPPIKMEPGVYTMDGPLWLTRGDQFRQNTLVGAGRRFNTNLGGSYTQFEWGAGAQVGVVVQGFRDARIVDITLKGPVWSALDNSGFGGFSPSEDDYDIATWYTKAGLTDRRYSPCAGVVLDPFVGTAPVGGAGLDAPYTVIDANAKPDWFGPLALYGRVTSTEFEMQRVEIAGWGTGLSINPSGTNFQTDFTSATRCLIKNCVVAVSVGQDQSRCVRGNDVNTAQCHTMVTNRRNGQKSGRLGGTLTLPTGVGIRALDLDLAVAGSLTVPDFYCESFLYLGDVDAGTAAGNGALVFLNGEGNFVGQPAIRGNPPHILGPTSGRGQGIAYKPVSFIGGNYIVSQACPILAQNLQLDNTNILVDEAVNGKWEVGMPFAIADATDRRHRKQAHNGTLGLITPLMFAGNQKIVGAVLDVGGAGGADINARTNNGFYPLSQRKYGIPHFQRRAQPSGYSSFPAYEYDMPQRAWPLDMAQLTAVSRAGRRWTFTIPAGYTEAIARARNIATGRVCTDDNTGTAFWVVSVDYATRVVVVEAMHNYYRPSGAPADSHRVPVNLAGPGNLYFIETAFFMTAVQMIGDVTAGNATVTNLRGPDGDNTWLTNPQFTPTNPMAGDLVYYDETQGNAFPFSGANAKIVTFDTAAKSMTMTGGANFTRTGVVFPLCRRGD